MDLVATVEAWLQEESEKIHLEKIETAKIYYSANHYLLETPKDLQRDVADGQAKSFHRTKELEIIETPRAIVFASNQSSYPLLERLSETAGNRQSDGFVAGAKIKKARLAEAKTANGEKIPALILDDAQAPSFWSSTILMRYHLTIEGRPAEVTIIGKLLGAPQHILGTLKQKLAGIKESKILVFGGDLFIPPELGLEENSIMPYLEKLGFEIFVPRGIDLRLGWRALRSGLGQGENRQWTAGNLKPTDPDEKPFFKPWVIKEINGLRLGFFGLLSEENNNLFAAYGVPYRIAEPLAAARNILEELRKQQRVDAVICLSQLKREDDARLIQATYGIDVLIGDYSDEVATVRQTLIELSHWHEEKRHEPALHALSSEFGFGEIKLEFQPATGAAPQAPKVPQSPAAATGYALTAVEELSQASGQDREGAFPELAALQDRFITFFTRPQEMLLPDPRRLWPKQNPPKIQFEAEEFWNLAAQILSQEAKTEVAFFPIRRLNSSAPGETPYSFVWQWLYPKEKLVTLKLSGRALRALAKRCVFEKIPVDIKNVSFVKYIAQTRLAAAGLDEQGRVRGLPLRNDEFYSVAVPESLLENKELVEFKQAQNVRRHEADMHQIILEWLARRKRQQEEKTTQGEARQNYERQIRLLCEGKTPAQAIWRLNLRELNLQIADTQVRNTLNYPEIPDARAQALNQIFARTTMEMFSEVYWGKVTWNTGFTADYGRLTLKPENAPPIKNEAIDRLLAETDLSWRIAYVGKNFFDASLGPFINFSEDTELTKPTPATGLARRQFVRVKPGLKIYQGRHLQELSLAALYQRNYAKPLHDDDKGWETKFSWTSPLPRSHADFQIEGHYRRIEPDAADTVLDLRAELNIRAGLKVPLWGDLNLSPFVDLYHFRGQLGQPLGKNTIVGVALNFNRLWKPIF